MSLLGLLRGASGSISKNPHGTVDVQLAGSSTEIFHTVKSCVAQAVFELTLWLRLPSSGLVGVTSHLAQQVFIYVLTCSFTHPFIRLFYRF